MVTFLTPLAENSSAIKGSLGRAFAVSLDTEKLNQAGFCPCALREVSGLAELALGHLRYCLTDVPPQSNSRSGSFLGTDLVAATHPRGARRKNLDWPAEFLTVGVREAWSPQAAASAKPESERARDDLRHRVFFGLYRVSEETIEAVVFHCRPGANPRTSHLCYISNVSLPNQTRVKLNRVFFPR